MSAAMSFVSDRPAPGQVDPKSLAANQLAALRLLRQYRCYRARGGWQVPGENRKVTLATVTILATRRLVIHRNVNGQPRLELTGTGVNTLAVADQRKKP